MGSPSAMPYAQDIDACLAETVGAGGIGRDALDGALARLARPLARLRAARAESTLPLLAVPARTDDLAGIEDAAARLRQSVADIVVLGTGGSSLGGATLAALGTDAAAPRLHFLDNVDPDGFEQALAGLDPARTGALVVSKSGTTAETVAQALVLLPRLAAAGKDALAARAIVISDPAGTVTPIRRLAAHYGIPVMDHEPGIGGRFAALTNVGLLPAAIAGLDVGAVREGAVEALAMTLEAPSPAEAPAALGAALAVGLAEEAGIAATVLMPYLDRLAPLALWYRQLWAESLGKDGHGTTPNAARGTVDQHSQLQLWLAGPRDKMFTLILGAPEGTGPAIDTAPAGGDGLDYLAGRTMGDLLAAEQRATAETLARAGRPVRLLRVARAEERSLGALMMHFMLETILAADLLGVDPFDQPAVEEGKRLARDYLARMGAEPGKVEAP